MSYSMKAVFIVPHEYMTEERFELLLDDLRALPSSMIPYSNPTQPDAPLFTETSRFWDVMTNSVPVSMGGSTNPNPEYEDPLQLPTGFERLIVWVSESSMLGMPEQHDRLLGVLKKVFIKMNAEYCVTLHELDLAVEIMPWEEFRTLLGGVHIFSQRLVDAIAQDRLSNLAPDSGLLDGGIWLRFQEEYFYGMPLEYHERMRQCLEEIWKKVEIL